MFVITGVYAGRRRLRASGGRLYLHIPRDLVEVLGDRRVRVTAIVNAEECASKRLNGSIIQFAATLVRIGATYRVYVPSKYASELAEIVGCSTLDVWLVPVPGEVRAPGVGNP
jgi:hypothetical protein